MAEEVRPERLFLLIGSVPSSNAICVPAITIMLCTMLCELHADEKPRQEGRRSLKCGHLGSLGSCEPPFMLVTGLSLALATLLSYLFITSLIQP